MDAYVYIHRSTTQTDGSTKVGSHTGTLQKLWTRYKTYTGSQQEFKVFATHPDDVVATERFIQSQLDQNGLWLENERFKPQAWAAFDMHARECLMSGETIKSVQLSDKMLTVTDMRMDAVNEVPSDTSFLNYRTLESLTYRVFGELKAQNLYRIEGSGDIVKRHNDLPYWYDHVSTAKDFINQVCGDIPKYFSSPNYLTAMVRTLRNVESSQSPFITVDQHIIGYKNGILRITDMKFTPLDQISKTNTRARLYFNVDYENDAATPIFQDFLQTQFGDDQNIKAVLMALIGSLMFPKNEIRNPETVLNITGTGCNLMRNFFKSLHASGTVAYVHNGKQIGNIRESDFVIVNEDCVIDVDHPIYPIMTDNAGDILMNERCPTNEPATIQYVLFSSKPLLPFAEKSISSFDIQNTGQSLRDESPFILVACLKQYKNIDSLHIKQPIAPLGPLPRSSLQEFILENFVYDKNNALGIPLTDLRNEYRDSVTPSMARRYPMTEDAFRILHSKCTATKPKKCQNCSTIKSKGIKCCDNYKATTSSFTVKYIQHK